ncbi:MAG: type II toxin-antitoxin system HigB family toxin [Caldilineaceae bacterium]
MHLVSIQTLRKFWKLHPDAEKPLRAWYEAVTQAQWRTPAEIKADFATASFLGNNRVVFNIKGNDYRLVVIVEYRMGRMFVRFVGTHAEYDRIDAERI